jgi:hypothetical protein
LTASGSGRCWDDLKIDGFVAQQQQQQLTAAAAADGNSGMDF